MKFTPSSSVSSTTTNTSNSINDNFCASKANNFGCLFGFLTRILCSKTLPTYPIQSESKQHFFKIVDGSTTPNIVAKLMGLDSIPDFHSRIPQKISGSGLGSGSIDQVKPRNSEEKTGDFEWENHRSKTSFSFKETPEFFEVEDDDFFLPSKIEKKKRGRKQRRKRSECVFSTEDRVNLQVPAQNSQNFDKNVGVRRRNHHPSPLKEKKEETEGIKARKKKKKKKETCLENRKEEEEESERENLSPVSVLDHTEFNNDHEPATSGEEDVNLRTIENSMWEERIELKKRKQFLFQNRANRLAEEEIANNSKWLYREELENAVTHFGQLIFDHLLNEFVQQLVHSPPF